jgi:signal transduction histidine kinase
VSGFGARDAILLAEVASYLASALAVGTILIRARPGPSGLWTLANLAAALAVLLIVLRPSLPAWLGHPMLNNTFGLGGIALFALALRRRRQPQAGLRVLAPPLLSLLAILAAIRVVEVDRAVWVACLSLAYVAAMVWVATEASRLTAQPPRPIGAWQVAGSFGLLAVFFFARAMGLLLAHPQSGLGALLVGPEIASIARLTLLIVANAGFVSLILVDIQREEAAALMAAARATERERAAQRDNTVLRALLEERAGFIDVLSHEVRQPLNDAVSGIEMLAEAVRAEPVDPPGLIARAQRALDVLDRIAGALNNTLAAATALDRQAKAHRRPTRLAWLLETVRLGLPDAERARVVIVLETTTAEALLDPHLMELALRNLLRNALQHGDPDAPIVLSLDQPEPGTLCFAVENQPGQAVVADAELVFTRQPRRRGGAGNSLGLWIVGRVAALHGGRARGRVGSVTRVLLEVPLRTVNGD